MKKVCGLIVAALLVCGFAGQAMATTVGFGTGDLIRVVYTPSGTYEYATDLGSLTSLENTNNNLIAGSSFTGYAGTDYANLNVTYYVYGGATSAYIAAPSGSKAPVVQGAFSGMGGVMNSMKNNYSNTTNQIVTTAPRTARYGQTSANSYVLKMDGGKAYVGTYDQYLTTNVEASLASLANTDGSVSMYLYAVTSGATGPGTLLKNSDGTIFDIVTLASGTEIMKAAAPVPVPPSMLLLGTGLLGLIGFRRKGASHGRKA